MKVVRPVQNLIDEFKKLPTIGPKTAARLVYFLLRAPEEEAERLADALRDLKQKTTVCQICYNIAESNPCDICTDPDREDIICVVEEPLDVLAVERTGKYQGRYHVLGGVINPLAGVGPEELRTKELIERLGNRPIREVVLAMNPTVEGEATAMFIKKQVQNSRLKTQNLEITRLARGLPTGGDLEYADSTTLTRALEGRTEF